MNQKKKFKKILLFALMFLLPLMSISSKTIGNNNYRTSETQSSIREDLIKEVRTYITSVYANCPNEIVTAIVNEGLTNDIDICFIMAQGQIETGFGKAGIGRSTSRRSIFGVEKRKYANYTECVHDYVTILKTSYLVRGKTEKHLMKNYVNKNGYRYASSTSYEGKLSKCYKKISSSTNITKLQTKYKTMS